MKGIIKGYQQISLAELNSRASLLHRTDNKYVLNSQQISAFLSSHQLQLDLLTIDGHERFQYNNFYLDSDGYKTFFDHNKGRRKRFKIRFRHYTETDLYFFEVKVKGFRNETLKYRILSDSTEYHAGHLPDRLRSFANETLNRAYGESLCDSFNYRSRVNYRRMTLVAKTSETRITIDNNIQFINESCTATLPNKYFIVEVKSRLGRSETDKWFWQNQLHPVRSCSKYGMAVSLLVFPDRNTRFRSVLKRYFPNPNGHELARVSDEKRNKALLVVQ